MSEVHRVAVEIGGTEIAFETGKMAKQASGAVTVTAGDTVVLSTATAGNLRDVDFLPLTVDVEERMYAAGKIPGSFFKREGRAGEKATLIARMIDRPLRPLFPKGWRRETQLVNLTLSVDQVHPYDILAMNGASAALMVSDVPYPTAVGAVRIGKIEGNFVVNPTDEQLLTTDMDLVVAGTDEAVLMVECGANEVPEAEILDALDIAHDAIKKLCAAQVELQRKAGKPKQEIEVPKADDGADRQDRQVARQEARRGHVRHRQAGAPVGDEGRRGGGAREVLRDGRRGRLRREAPGRAARVRRAREALIRQRIAVHKKRPDGRSEREIRQITVDVKPLPRTHGSALFTRGQTQALSVVALGTTREEMRLDNLGLETSKRYFHHYNFPPFSVGEAGFMRGPKRRDIGHGALAERALVPMIPDQETFPYTIRVVSDILESNGSSSMASVCGSSLSLMDAGVPLKRPVAGIAMGLIKEGDDYVILSDIAGVEDHLGDMDFKVAGTSEGITALQMDIKITGVTFEIMSNALDAGQGRSRRSSSARWPRRSPPRASTSPSTPRGSARSRSIRRRSACSSARAARRSARCRRSTSPRSTSTTRAMVLVYAVTGAKGDALVERIRSMTKEVEVGDEFPTGKVVKTTTFGAFVELAKGTDGLLHISNVSPGNRVGTVEEVLNKGDEISVRVVEVDKERGRIGLRLAEDPDIAGKTKEELASVGTGDPTMGGGGDRRAAAAAATATAVAGAAAATAAAAAVTATARPRGDRDPDRAQRGGHPRAPPRSPTSVAAIPGHRITELDSGLRIVTEAMPSVRSAALGFFVATGSRGESVAEAGLSHFLEHLLFRGTDRYASAEIDQLFDGMGAELNAGTDKESTAVYARMLDQHLPAAFDVMADMVWRPAFKDVDPEREVVLEEIAMYEDDPQDTVFDVLGEAVFGGHPLGRPDHRPRAGDPRHAGGRDRRLPRPPLRAGHGRDRRGGQRRPRPDRGARHAHGRRARRRSSPLRRPSRRRPRPARTSASSARTPSRCTSRSAASACSAATTAASPPASWTRSSAASPRAGSSRPCARSAGSPTASTRSPASTPTRARSASTSAPARTTWSRR